LKDRAPGSLLLPMIRQGLPLALGMASHALFNLVDLLLVGRLGADAVAGVHVATTINFLPMILGNGISIATMSVLARRVGSGDMTRARELSSRWQMLMPLLGIAVGVLGALLVYPCVDLQGVEGRARDIGVHYLLVTNLGTVTMFVVMQTTASMRALGESLMPFALLFGCNVLNLLLDVVLLFGWDAMAIPAFGAPGAAYATVIARAAAAGIGLWWLSRPGCGLRLRWVSLRGGRAEQMEVLRLGLPQSLQMLMREVAVVALTRIAGDLGGQSAIVALGVTTRLDTLVLFAAMGFASAATTVVGLSCGAGRFDAARRACRWAGLCAFVFSAMLVLTFLTWAKPIIALFVEEADASVIAAGVLYLSIAALGHPFASVCLALTGGFTGAGRVLPPVVLDLIGFAGLLLPATIAVASFVDTAGLGSIWWIFAGVNVLLAAAYWVYLERARWMLPRVSPGTPDRVDSQGADADCEPRGSTRRARSR